MRSREDIAGRTKDSHAKAQRRNRKERYDMRLLYYVSLLAVFLTVVTAAARAQQANLPSEVIAYADSVFYHGKILTADDKFTIAEAVAIRDGKFLAIGKSDRILQMAGPKTLKFDLKGKTAVPGIIDLHQHPFTEGLLSYWAEKWVPNQSEWRNGQEALDGIQKAVARAKPGQVIVIPRIHIGPAANEEGGRVGEAICDFETPEQKYRAGLPCAARASGNICEVLTRKQIDSVSPNNPVVFVEVVNINPHAINSAAAEAIKQYFPGGKVPFVEEGSACLPGAGAGLAGIGAAAGEIPPIKIVHNYLVFWSEPFEDILAAYRIATRGVSSAGITLTKEHTAMQTMAGIRELWARGELTVRMRMPYPLTPLSAQGNEVSVAPEQAEMLFRSIGNMSGIGDDMLRFVGIRPNAVGGNFQLGLVWTLDPKLRPYKGPDIKADVSLYGRVQQGPQGELQGKEVFDGRAAVVQAVRFGWDVSADHTIGDRAVQEVLNAFEEGLKTQVVKRPGQRLTMNHVPMSTPSDVERSKRLGVFTSIGPFHIYSPDMLDGGLSAYGTERVNKMMPIKSYISLGAKPSLEGDVSVSPFWRMEKAITRKDDKYNRIWNPTEAVSRQEALWMSTNWPAYHIGEEKKLGTIEPGKLADMVIITKDYMTVPENQIHEIYPEMTILGGKVVYEVGK